MNVRRDARASMGSSVWKLQSTGFDLEIFMGGNGNLRTFSLIGSPRRPFMLATPSPVRRAFNRLCAPLMQAELISLGIGHETGRTIWKVVNVGNGDSPFY